MEIVEMSQERSSVVGISCWRWKSLLNIAIVFMTLCGHAAYAVPPEPRPGQSEGFVVSLESAPNGTGISLENVTLRAGVTQVFYGVLFKDKKKNDVYRLSDSMVWQAASPLWEVTNQTTSSVSIRGRTAGAATLRGADARYGQAESAVTIVPGDPFAISIERLPDGNGGVIGSLEPLSAGVASIPLYPVLRDIFGNYIGLASGGEWSYSGHDGGFVASGGGVQFSATRVASGETISFTFPGLPVATMDGVSIVAGEPRLLSVESSADGGGIAIDVLPLLTAGVQTDPLFAVIRDQWGNFIRTAEDAAWEYDGGGGSFFFEAPGVRFASTQVASNRTISSSYPGLSTDRITGISTAPGPLSALAVETADDGSGNSNAALSMHAGESQQLSAIGRDAFGNFVGPLSVSWITDAPAGTFVTISEISVTFLARSVGVFTITAEHALLGKRSVSASVFPGEPSSLRVAAPSSADAGICQPVTLRFFDAYENATGFSEAVEMKVAASGEAAWYNDLQCKQLVSGPISLTTNLTSLELFVGDLRAEQVTFSISVKSLAAGFGMEFTGGALGGGKAFAMSDRHICIRNLATELECWGSGPHGELGNGKRLDVVEPSPVLEAANERPLKGVIDVVAGYTHSCAVTDDGAAWCWGSDGTWQLGNQYALQWPQGYVPDSLVPSRVLNSSGSGGISGVSAISSSQNHNCAIADGVVNCWGYNGEEESGREHSSWLDNGVPLPNPIESLGSGVLAVDAGIGHSCAIKADHTVWCWGSQKRGGLGSGLDAIGYTAYPKLVVTSEKGPALIDVASLSVGREHSCAVSSNGQLWCWGEALNWGYVRSNWSGYFAYAVGVYVPGTVVDVAVGEARTCAVTSDGNVYCVGRDPWGYGHLGMPVTGLTRMTMVPLPTSENFVKVDAAWFNTCAYAESGRLYCWGQNLYGQLRSGNKLPVLNPVLTYP